MTAPSSQHHAYTAFGLRIRSAIPLQELEPAAGAEDLPPDLTIRLQPARTPELPEGTQVAFEHREGCHVLTWLAVGSFRILGPEAIEVAPAPGVEPGLIALPLLGPVMALLLHVRGLLVLHASAVDLGHGAVIFLGDKTAGKSTTASAFVRAGKRLLTDDIVAIDFSGPTPLIRPGFPQIKLDASAPAPGGDLGDVLPAPVAGFPKRQHRLAGTFSPEPARPLACYVLARGETTGLAPLPPQEGLMALMRFSYTVRFGKGAIGAEGEARHFRQCAALVGAAPVKRLQIAAGLDRLHEVVAIVAEDCN